MIKRRELIDPESCFNKAANDEPLFVLRAHDMLAPDLVTEWAERADAEGTPATKVLEALDCAAAMRAWQNKNGRKVPD